MPRRGSLAFVGALALAATLVPVVAASAAGATAAVLTGVSCSSANACVAVGAREVSTTRSMALVERLAGTTWSVVATPAPSGPSSSLEAVACRTGSLCMAVGLTGTTTSLSPLTELWRGAAWTIVAAPRAPGAQVTSLLGVACPSLTTCVAVGDASGRDGETPFAERWQSGRWRIEAVPVVHAGQGSELHGVSCTSPASCTAVGTSGTSALIEHWDGTSWSAQVVPNGRGKNPLRAFEAVSCHTPPTSCTAVGRAYSTEPGTQVTFAERSAGAAWTTQVTPSPPATPAEFGAGLTGVSCPSSTRCVAVGWRGPDASDAFGFTDVWNGTTWRLVELPGTHAGTGDVLESVSCTSGTSCVAAGLTFHATGSTPLLERWNGTTWKATTPAS